jgi:hypothetical protein
MDHQNKQSVVRHRLQENLAPLLEWVHPRDAKRCSPRREANG